MYQSGKVDIRLLKDILGHEQLNTTQIYTHVVNTDMQAAMKNNPLSELKIKADKIYTTNQKYAEQFLIFLDILKIKY